MNNKIKNTTKKIQNVQSLRAAFSVPLGINTYFNFVAILRKSLDYVAIL